MSFEVSKTRKLSTHQLVGAPLDWAVATALGETEADMPFAQWDTKAIVIDHYNLPFSNRTGRTFSPSTNWNEGGPIISALGMEFVLQDEESDVIWAIPARTILERVRAKKEWEGCYGPTHLVAAMRCFVLNELGEEVDVPEELL